MADHVPPVPALVTIPAPSTKPLWVGNGPTEPFNHHFSMGKQLGQAGQYGSVYACTRLSDQKQFAVKILNKNLFSHLSPQYVPRYYRIMQSEISVLSSLKNTHSNIISYETVFEDDSNLFIVMEKCNGGNLFDRISARERYTEKDASLVFRQLLKALKCIHSDKTIVHGDIKPGNLLFSEMDTNELKLIDFGMASKETTRSRNCFYGTPEYSPPEKRISAKGDVWACGIILFVMLFGYPPFYVNPSRCTEIQRRNKIYAKIERGFIHKIRDTKKYGYGAWYPDTMPISDNARDLLHKLLEKDIDKRISANEALKHPWFKENLSGKK